MKEKENEFKSNNQEFKLKKETLKFTLNFTSLYYVLGPLYCLSRKAVGAVVEFYEKYPMQSCMKMEDLLVGLAIEHQSEKFKLKLPFGYEKDLPKDTITIHDIKPVANSKKLSFKLGFGIKKILRNKLRVLRKRAQLIFWKLL